MVTETTMYKALNQRSVQSWSRRIHIYSSMVLLIAMLFFAVTGLTLNRPELFVGAPKIEEQLLNLPQSVLGDRASEYRPDYVDLVALLRKEAGLKGIASPLSLFTQVENGELVEGEVELDFKGPGYDASVFIDLTSGDAEIMVTRHGTVAWLNDLHKGRNTGPVWHLFIDIVSLIMILFTLTGAILLLPKKKTLGTAMKWTGAGTLITISCYYLSFT